MMHSRRGPMLAAWLLPLLLALGPAGTCMAAGAEPESAGDSGAGESSGTEAQADASDKPGNGGAGDARAPDEPADATPGKDGGPEVFIPTEEISEDFAVSFPVDI